MRTRATIKQSLYTFIMHTHSSYTIAKQSQIKTFPTDQWSLFIVYVRFHYKSCNFFSRFLVWFYFGIKNIFYFVEIHSYWIFQRTARKIDLINTRNSNTTHKRIWKNRFFLICTKYYITILMKISRNTKQNNHWARLSNAKLSSLENGNGWENSSKEIFLEWKIRLCSSKSIARVFCL